MPASNNQYDIKGVENLVWSKPLRINHTTPNRYFRVWTCDTPFVMASTVIGWT